MGEKWEELQGDPIVLGLRAVLHSGLYEIEMNSLGCLPRLLGEAGSPADRTEIRNALLLHLRANDPTLDIDHPERGIDNSEHLDEETKFGLWIFRAAQETKNLKLSGARQEAGKLRGVQVDAVRKSPSNKQPRGGYEWRLILHLREDIIREAIDAGRDLPDDLVQTDDIRTDKPPMLSSEGGSETQDNPREDPQDIYQEIKGDDFKVNFFQRASTRHFLTKLAEEVESNPITLYVGRSFAADVTRDELMADSLEQWLVVSRFGEARARQIVEALQRELPPEYLGSIAREKARHYRRKEKDSDPNGEERFHEFLRSGIASGRDPGEFLALSIGLLAFALRASENNVRVVTTSYHDRITTEANDVPTRFSELDLTDYQFEPRGPSDFEKPLQENSIPLYCLNGSVSEDSASSNVNDPLVIGEADRFAQYNKELNPEDVQSAKRDHLLEDTLRTSVGIFVGSRLSNPDIIAKLAVTKYQQPRYAIIQSPDLGFADPADKAYALNLLAQRYLHLDLIPIIIDFSHQAPQLLIEIALRLHYGEDYSSYQDRLELWWDDYEDAPYFPSNGTQQAGSGKRDEELQRKWCERLDDARNGIFEHLSDVVPDKEQLQIRVDVWIRNPDRTLRMWATSDGLWLNAYSAPSCSIPDEEPTNKHVERAVQQAFRSGKVVYEPLEQPGRIWRHELCVPLVLHGDPWHHLPIGVTRIVSSANILPDAAKDGTSLKKRREQLTSHINDVVSALVTQMPTEPSPPPGPL